MHYFTVSVLSSALLIWGGFAHAEDNLRDLSVEQQMLATAPLPQVGALTVTAWVDHEDNVYAAGEAVSLSVMTNAAAYITVISVGPTGNAVQLYPNAFQPGEQIAAGEIFVIPGADAPAQIIATGPTGSELMRVIASTAPLDIIDPEDLRGAGAFREIAGGVATVVRDLAAVAAPANVELASYDKVIRTVEPEPAALAGSAETPPRAPMLSTDAASYAIGDLVTIAVTPLDPCTLWVVAVSEDDQVNVLFPNGVVAENRILARQTVLVSAEEQVSSVIAAGPAGQDVLYALCGADDTPPWEAGIDLSEGFAALSTEQPLGRALVQAATPQAADIPARFGWSVKILDIHP